MSNTVIKDVLKIFNKKWNQQVILYGPPGTSKTYSSTIIAAAMLCGVKFSEEDLKSEDSMEAKIRERLVGKLQEQKKSVEENASLYELASEFLKTRKKDYKLVQFHPSYSYEDFVRGITVEPETKEDGGKTVNTGNVQYKVESKIIETFCDDNKDNENPFVLIIDEINRAPLASVLGELIYGLEYRGEKISTPYVMKENDKEKDLIIPKNLYIIGTMNTADRSIGSMDYAVRRRFAFISVGSNPNSIADSWTDEEAKNAAVLLYEELMNDEGIFAAAYKADPEMDVEDIKIGHTYFLGRDGEGMDYLAYRVQYQILPIYQEYIKDGLIDKKGLARFKEILEKDIFKDKFQNVIANFPKTE